MKGPTNQKRPMLGAKPVNNKKPAMAMKAQGNKSVMAADGKSPSTPKQDWMSPVTTK